jgi:hypothetical protein
MTAGYGLVRDYIAKHGRYDAAGNRVVACSLCDAQVDARRVTTAHVLGELIVVCSKCRRTFSPRRAES